MLGGMMVVIVVMLRIKRFRLLGGSLGAGLAA